MLKQIFLYSLLLTTLTVNVTAAFGRQYAGFDRAAYYTAMSSGKEDRINEQLQVFQDLDFEGKAAFEGALLMKKANIVSTPKEKLQLFKQGKSLLEEAINKDKSNIEFRFLRLMIQENAPPILNYKANLEEDAQLVKTGFNNFPQVTRKFILEYSVKSKVLNAEDFK